MRELWDPQIARGLLQDITNPEPCLVTPTTFVVLDTIRWQVRRRACRALHLPSMEVRTVHLPVNQPVDLVKLLLLSRPDCLPWCPVFLPRRLPRLPPVPRLVPLSIALLAQSAHWHSARFLLQVISCIIE
jgi:hypothetical protein